MIKSQNKWAGHTIRRHMLEDSSSPHPGQTTRRQSQKKEISVTIFGLASVSCSRPVQLIGQLRRPIIPYASCGTIRALCHGLSIGVAVASRGHSLRRQAPPTGPDTPSRAVNTVLRPPTPPLRLLRDLICMSLEPGASSAMTVTLSRGETPCQSCAHTGTLVCRLRGFPQLTPQRPVGEALTTVILAGSKGWDSSAGNGSGVGLSPTG